jgi:MerR family transcriptional regulator, thiopeptide resistance regulator
VTVSSPYDAEAQQRWSHTEAFRESRRRAARYDAADWARLQDEARDIERRLADALLHGVPADAVAAMDLAEEHRGHLGRWFYDCPPSMHRGLADLYVADERFTAHYDDVLPGLARYVSAAIHANADRRDGGAV